MTPEEIKLVNDLFDRLASLESAPRDGAAERLIADGLNRAPHALYALAQTALVQDEALKRANGRIEELQAELEGAAAAPEPQQQPSFLDSMREAFGGRPAPTPTAARGSVPSVHAGGYQASPTYAPPPTPPNYTTPPNYAAPPNASPAVGSGGSFLGSAASTAAGVIGGAFLLDGIRSMFGHRSGGLASSAFADAPGDRASPDRTSPWSASTSGSAADSDLARGAGINDIGQAATRDRDDDANTTNHNGADPFLSTDDADSDDTDDADIADADTDDDDDFGYDDGSSGGDSYDA